MYGFLAGFSSPESIFAEKNTYWKTLIWKSGMKLHTRLKMMLTTKTRGEFSLILKNSFWERVNHYYSKITQKLLNI